MAATSGKFHSFLSAIMCVLLHSRDSRRAAHRASSFASPVPDALPLPPPDETEVPRVPKPTVFRILPTLETLGYVLFDGALETYRISQRLKDLGQSNVSELVSRLARPIMMTLDPRVGATCRRYRSKGRYV